MWVSLASATPCTLPLSRLLYCSVVHSFNETDIDKISDKMTGGDGTNIKRKTFEATFLALSNKHNFLIISKPNLPTSNYSFEKDLMEEINIMFSKRELCVHCNTTINDGKGRNESCNKFNSKPNDHEIDFVLFHST